MAEWGCFLRTEAFKAKIEGGSRENGGGKIEFSMFHRSREDDGTQQVGEPRRLGVYKTRTLGCCKTTTVVK